jgi:transcription elongation factor Elf1
MDPDNVICVYCKRNAEVMASADRTVVICRNCGIAMELETYKELFDKLIFRNSK